MSTHAAESVAIGHPDKAADQVSDAILDAYLTEDPKARVDITTLLSHNTILLAGEITSHVTVNHKEIALKVLNDIGYDTTSCQLLTTIVEQSEDIAQAVKKGAGDQGIMVGYATDETKELMPLAATVAHKLMQALAKKRPLFGPDGKVLVSVADSAIESIVLSAQHSSSITVDEVRAMLHELIYATIEQDLSTTKLYLNPGGRFVLGGPNADTGLTGRKIIVDCYGTAAAHGGGAFSGKDPTKVDRSASYMARYIAKNIVAQKLAKRCQVSLHYAIGIANPIGLSIDTFGTSQISEKELEAQVPKVFDLSVGGIIETLKLNKPIYRPTAWGGHFGRSEFSWEALIAEKII